VTQCPEHPRALTGGTKGCTACAKEAATTDHAAGAARVRQALHQSPRPNRVGFNDSDTRQAAIERARAERLAAARARIDAKEQP
jgi:hypothetical protein